MVLRSRMEARRGGVRKTASDAQKRARAVQKKPCCECYCGLSGFNTQDVINADVKLRKILIKHESLDTTSLWVKLHKHGYHSIKEEVSRFKYRRNTGSLKAAPAEAGNLRAKAEAEHKMRWEAQRAAEKARSDRMAAERAAAVAALQQKAAEETAAAEKAAAEKAAREAAVQRAAMVSMIETAADKAAGKVVLAQSSSRALVLARVCEKKKLRKE